MPPIKTPSRQAASSTNKRKNAPARVKTRKIKVAPSRPSLAGAQARRRGNGSGGRKAYSLKSLVPLPLGEEQGKGAVAPAGKVAGYLTGKIRIPLDQNHAEIQLDGRMVKLTNLQKPFWPEDGIRKGDLLQYYADAAPLLLPHLRDRAMVMKRYPHGAAGEFFFQKRAPDPRPEWIDVCTIPHGSGNIIDFPIVRDVASLLWIINLGCIDLNPWYGRCDDFNRPDYLHFDLDPVEGADFDDVRQTALLVHAALDALKAPNFAKTTGSRGIHVYVPIERGPLQKEVWTFAKEFAQTMANLYPDLITAEYRIAKRPKGRVLVDYNQNAWGRTLSSVYSVRPKPRAPVSTPVTWEEIEEGMRVEDFRLDNVRERLAKTGDLWAPVAEPRGRMDFRRLASLAA